MQKKNKKDKHRSLIEAGVALTITAALVLGGYMLVKGVKHGGGKKQAIQMVKLVTPPPPPKPVEKPPEPEIQKEQPKEDQVVEAPKENNQPKDEGPPPGLDLGVDAEGGAGGDAFGLVGRKGGRDLIGGGGAGGGDGGLMRKYGAYISMMQDEISRQLSRKAKLPAGGLQVNVRVVLDGEGAIISHALIGSSGNAKADEAVEEALKLFKRMSEPPPEGMPHKIRLRIIVPA